MPSSSQRIDGSHELRRAARSCRRSDLPGSIDAMAEAAQQPLERELEEIGAQLAWVRDYL
jgi:hypothetical protein